MTPTSSSAASRCRPTERPRLCGNRVRMASTRGLLAHERDLVEARLPYLRQQRHHLPIGHGLVGAHVHDLVRVLAGKGLETPGQVAGCHRVAAEVEQALRI